MHPSLEWTREPQHLEETSVGESIAAFMGLLALQEVTTDHDHSRVVRTTPERVGQLRAMSYDRYLLTEEWTQTSSTMRSIAKNHCELCGVHGRVLNVHHLNYERVGEELCSDLIVVCHSCHMYLHAVCPTTRARSA